MIQERPSFFRIVWTDAAAFMSAIFAILFGAFIAYDFLRGPKGAQLYSQLVALYNWAQSSDHAPTAAMRTRAAELASDLAARVKAIQAMREGSVAALERAVSEARLPRLVLPAMAP